MKCTSALFFQLMMSSLCELSALGKTFSVRKKKGKLKKAWEGSKVVYNVASWGATAIGYMLSSL